MANSDSGSATTDDTPQGSAPISLGVTENRDYLCCV